MVCDILPVLTAGFFSSSDETMVRFHAELPGMINPEINWSIKPMEMKNGMHAQFPQLEFECDPKDEERPIVRESGAGLPKMSPHYPGKPGYVVLVGKDRYIDIS